MPVHMKLIIRRGVIKVKHLKKVTYILLVLLMVFGISACGGSGSSNGNGSGDDAGGSGQDTNVFLMSWNDGNQVVALTINTPSDLHLKKVDDESLFRFDNRHTYGGLLASDDLLFSPGCTYLYPQATIDEYIESVSASYDNVQKITVDGQDASIHHDSQQCFYWITIDGLVKGMGEKAVIQMEICRNTMEPNSSVSDIIDEEGVKSIVEGMTFEVMTPDQATEKYPNAVIFGTAGEAQ